MYIQKFIREKNLFYMHYLVSFHRPDNIIFLDLFLWPWKKTSWDLNSWLSPEKLFRGGEISQIILFNPENTKSSPLEKYSFKVIISDLIS